MMTAPATTNVCFIDTNIWFYALTTHQDQQKTQQANAIISTQSHIVVSTQVINELCTNLIKKAAFIEQEIQRLITDFYTHYHVVEIGQDILLAASHLREQHHVSFWDSLVVASAINGAAKIIYSEDMQHSLQIGQTTIINPFYTHP